MCALLVGDAWQMKTMCVLKSTQNIKHVWYPLTGLNQMRTENTMRFSRKSVNSNMQTGSDFQLNQTVNQGKNCSVFQHLTTFFWSFQCVLKGLCKQVYMSLDMYIPFCDRLMKGKLKQPPLQLKPSKTDLIVVVTGNKWQTRNCKPLKVQHFNSDTVGNHETERKKKTRGTDETGQV